MFTTRLPTRTLPKTLASRTFTTLPRTLPRALPKIHHGPQLLQRRPLTTLQKLSRHISQSRKNILRKNPILFPLALFSLATATAIFTYIAYIEYTTVAPQYHKFPPPVADALRTAVYYTEVDLNPPKALQAYKEALRVAIEMGVHPFSDEVVGIKLQVAHMLEKAGLVKAAVEVLERTKGEILGFVEKGSSSKGSGSKGLVQKGGSEGGEGDLEEKKKQQEMAEYEDRQRDRVLKKAVGIEMKLAELYASDYMQDDKKAEAAQVAAVELCLKEMNRRQSLGLPVGGGSEEAWLNVTEIATALSDLAGRYTESEKYELAMPLYLRALDLLRVEEGEAPSCKQVVLLNDVASAMAGQAQSPIRAPDPAKAREQLVDAARQWAQKSIDMAARIQPPVRDQDCDTSCVAATYNLGELAEFQGKGKEAERLYREAKSLAEGLGFEEGVAMTDSALKRVTKK
ncbi:TPR domain protein [Aspergillus alliaceus]|uniref:TPR domain protein n=1 Tax=Petromyces alliaceus TaxID=209559 RepID=UPI0012A4FCD3|nr:uncharacterized protein BDW43DRAFT_267777 [Aspergillus alliaceus]KAB8236190.1 hypothetical protein BDW43DRAFT_267777 [Aspergillus alliaceus]